MRKDALKPSLEGGNKREGDLTREKHCSMTYRHCEQSMLPKLKIGGAGEQSETEGAALRSNAVEGGCKAELCGRRGDPVREEERCAVRQLLTVYKTAGLQFLQ